MKRAQRIRRWCVFRLAHAFGSLLALLPHAWALAIARRVGHAAFIVDSRGRARAIAQLTRAVGHDAATARTCARRVYENMGMIAVEIALLERHREALLDRVELGESDRRILEAAMASGRGIVFVTGHVGNWELLAQKILRDGPPGFVLARESPNPFIARWIEKLRAEGHLETINRGGPRSLRTIVAALERGAIVGVLIDQDAKVPSIHVPFFGRLAKTPTVAARLALRRRCPTILGTIHRKDDDPTRHEICLERVDRAFAEYGPGAVADLTTDLTLRLEATIRQRPEEWVWFHRRWKTPPSAEDRALRPHGDA